MIRSIFLYLDRTFVLQTKQLRAIWDLGLDLYRRAVLEPQEIRSYLFEVLLRKVDSERRGEVIDRTLMHSLIHMLIDLKAYAGVFEVHFIEATSAFYREEAARSIAELDMSSYLHYVDRRLKEESARIEHYLDKVTRKALTMMVEKECLSVHIPTLLSKGFVHLMDEQRVDDLKLLHSLFQRVAELESIRLCFADYIKVLYSLYYTFNHDPC
jgi:cullin-4